MAKNLRDFIKLVKEKAPEELRIGEKLVDSKFEACTVLRKLELANRTIRSRANRSASASAMVDLPALLAPRKAVWGDRVINPLWIPRKPRISIWQIRIAIYLQGSQGLRMQKAFR